ncbi:M14 family metallopeptidase [Amphibacillus cookii]|uniref:M14 family metallopeptidase n=1 Tax=Amphibacillus cookii TaxID=767787 RepID=UPI001957BEC4|nr:M14 family metallocarboxypeptidase [Amphibacillus cookii]MBM7541476.1 g-D-glutamyl-meso-diaminopimelate peptidase [Amphibacillus cookii]
MIKFNPDRIYSFECLKDDLTRLADQYVNEVKLETIGYSVTRREILAVKVGSGKKIILCHGTHHAREWLTTTLLVDFIVHILQDNSWPWLTIREDWLNLVSFWFIPMVNPDGVTLVQEGLNRFDNAEALLKWNKESTDFTSWKANSRGVDLNRQYPTDWESIKGNPGAPSSSHFKGYQPLSEPEVQAVYHFVKKRNIDVAIAYHSSGEEIFWRYRLNDTIVEKQLRPLAEALANITGYRLINPSDHPSGGGFTDWFLTTYKRPGFTIEIAPSVGPQPVPLHLYKQVFQSNELVLYTIAEHLIKEKDV